ncbi:disease resistance-like protein DSC1 [Corylus avellana]|uniref:disease resistance-like protein DSC1 n=1 Tax=Corylus avellana TaxID=13451 RepID=UPI00286D07C5|nr:disease resistance-like protein DSC1 [Corylus avellana]
MVGIFGVGGIGKTTIAEAIYNSIAHQFEDKCFLENVRENSKQEYGLLKLQEKLLSQILRDSNLKVRTVNLGKDAIKKRLCMKKVLLVLDDVDDLIQLEALSGELDWFGLESRIIITTRDKQLLATHGVDLRHKMNELRDCEALKVFSRHAFHSDKPNDDFVELTEHALCYAGGNPLALKVGTENIKGILVDLPERDLIQWKSDTFENMEGLRYFICRNAEFSEEPTYVPDELRVLDWIEYPLQSLPSNFHGRKLTILRICNGHFKGVKEGFKNLPNLTIMELIALENLTEIPDISRIPNLQKLHISDCKSLVEVHDSVGSLDKLVWLSFFNCSNLISLPKSLKVKSGGGLYFLGCSRLETFPEIECKMEQYSLTLDVFDCINLIHLPSSIFQLKFISLSVLCCPKLVMTPTNVRDERQSPEESRDLFLSPPLLNSSISDVGCSYSAQTGLKLDRIHASFDILTISGSEIVSLPAWFKTFIRLRVLRLEGCKQLQEILELPANIVEVSACRCVSLESFPQISRENQFNTSQLPSLEWIDLSDCYKMADKIGKVEDFVLDKVHYKDSFAGGIIFPGNKIPDWFRHRMGCPMGSRTCIMDIKGLPHLDEIQGIVFCAVLQPFSNRIINEDARFTMRNRGRDIHKLRDFIDMKSKNVWYEYFFQESFELKGDCLQVRLVTNPELTIRSFGVHIIHKHEENANDHPNMPLVESFSFDEINHDWKISSIQDESDEECENSVGSLTKDESDEERLELSECAKMVQKIGNDQVEEFLLEKVHSKDSFDGRIFSGNRIPDWFRHPMKCRIGWSNSCIMNIKGLPHLDEVLIQGIIFCAVLKSDLCSGNADCVHSAKFTMEHKGIEFDKMKDFNYMKSENVWYEYFQESFELNGDSLLQVRLVTDFQLSIKSFGVHIIHKHEENANNQPEMTHVESCFSFRELVNCFPKISSTQDESSTEDESDEESENSECSIIEESVVSEVKRLATWNPVVIHNR